MKKTSDKNQDDDKDETASKETTSVDAAKPLTSKPVSSATQVKAKFCVHDKHGKFVCYARDSIVTRKPCSKRARSSQQDESEPATKRAKNTHTRATSHNHKGRDVAGEDSQTSFEQLPDDGEERGDDTDEDGAMDVEDGDEKEEDEEPARRFYVFPGEDRLVFNISRRRAIEGKGLRCRFCIDAEDRCHAINIRQACGRCNRRKTKCEFETADFVILDNNGEETNDTFIPVLARRIHHPCPFARRQKIGSLPSGVHHHATV